MPNLISSEGLHWKVDFYCGCLIVACCGLLLINLIGHILHSAFPKTAQYSTEAGKCLAAWIVQKWCVHRCKREIGVELGELGKIEVELGRFGVNLHKYYSPSLLPNSVHSLLVHFKLCTLHLKDNSASNSSAPLLHCQCMHCHWSVAQHWSWNGWRERELQKSGVTWNDQAQFKQIDSRYKYDQFRVLFCIAAKYCPNKVPRAGR